MSKSDLILEPMLIWETGEGDYITKNFHCMEFEDEDSRVSMISLPLVETLQLIRTEFGEPLKITSAYRSQYTQQRLKDEGYQTAAGISQHELGRAVDISTIGMTSNARKKLIDLCTKHFKAIGIANTFIHVDMRDDKVRTWGY